MTLAAGWGVGLVCFVVAEIVNIQPLGNMAKAYQVKQIRAIILKYKLAR